MDQAKAATADVVLKWDFNRGRAKRGWGKTSRFKCVYRRPGGHYRAAFRFRGVLYSCGSHVTEEAASRAVAAKRAELVAAMGQ